MVGRVSSWIKKLETHAESSWYPVAVGLIAFADNFIFMFPVVALAVTSILLAKKRWLPIVLFITVGNALGAALFAELISIYGLPLIHRFAPSMPQLEIWKASEIWFGKYGDWALFGNSMLPLTDHPMLVIAALSKTSMPLIFLASFSGKVIKYIILTWVTLRAPGLLGKTKFLKKEIKEIT